MSTILFGIYGDNLSNIPIFVQLCSIKRSKMKLAFIGIGNVGFAIANKLQQNGHEIIVASTKEMSKSLDAAVEKNPNFSVLPLQDAIDNADVIFVATPFFAVEALLSGIDFKGKTLIDCTNPIGAGLTHGLKSVESGSEYLQKVIPSANVVKAFTIYGYENLAEQWFENEAIRPMMPFAGNNNESKILVAKLIEEMGFEAMDCGELSQALHLEHMTLLWVTMVRKGQLSPKLVWAAIKG